MNNEHHSHTLRDLTDAQLAAIRLILEGGTDEMAAHAAGKSRETVNRWRNHHPEFRAELNRRRKAIHDGHADMIRMINGLVLGELEHSIRDGDPGAIDKWLRTGAIGKINTAVPELFTSDAVIDEQVARGIYRENLETEGPNSISLLSGGPGPVEIREAVEADLRVLADCEPLPQDIASGRYSPSSGSTGGGVSDVA